MNYYLTYDDYDYLNLTCEQIECIERLGYACLDDIGLTEFQKQCINSKIKNYNI